MDCHIKSFLKLKWNPKNLFDMKKIFLLIICILGLVLFASCFYQVKKSKANKKDHDSVIVDNKQKEVEDTTSYDNTSSYTDVSSYYAHWDNKIKRCNSKEQRDEIQQLSNLDSRLKIFINRCKAEKEFENAYDMLNTLLSSNGNYPENAVTPFGMLYAKLYFSVDGLENNDCQIEIRNAAYSAKEALNHVLPEQYLPQCKQFLDDAHSSYTVAKSDAISKEIECRRQLNEIFRE